MPKITFSPFKPVFSIPVGKHMSMTPGGRLVIHPAAPEPVKPAAPKPAPSTNHWPAMPALPGAFPPVQVTVETVEHRPTPAEMRDRPDTWSDVACNIFGGILVLLMTVVFMANFFGPFLLKGGPGR